MNLIEEVEQVDKNQSGAELSDAFSSSATCVGPYTKTAKSLARTWCRARRPPPWNFVACRAGAPALAMGPMTETDDTGDRWRATRSYERRHGHEGSGLGLHRLIGSFMRCVCMPQRTKLLLLVEVGCRSLFLPA